MTGRVGPASSGSREPGLASRPGPSGFDPARIGDRIAVAVEIAPHLDPNTAGELLRELCFAGDEYGCYSTFDLVEGFEPVAPETLSLLVRTAMAGCWAKDPTTIAQMHGYVHPATGLGVAWYWDGDGTLVFKRDDFFIVNGDCKKDHEWESSEPGDWIHTYQYYETTEQFAAIASEAGTAETTEIGSVHEGAGRRHRPTPSGSEA